MALREQMCSAMEEHFFKALRKGWHLIKSDELKEKIDAGEKIFLLDVREPEEFASGHIQGAVNIPVQTLPGRTGELPKDLNSKIVSICLSGSRSAYATMFLKVYGYNNISNLDFGMTGWKDRGFPMAAGV